VLVSHNQTIKAQVLQHLDRNPLLTPKQLCQILQIDYKFYGHYISNLKTFWRYHTKNGLGSKCSNFPDSQHHVRAGGCVPECLDRRKYPEVTGEALKAGWIQSKNRNRALIWKVNQHSLGRIEWFENGTVSINVKAPVNIARARTLAGKGFGDAGLILSSRILSAFQESLRWGGAHDVYETKGRLPYKKITTYVDGYNLEIVLGDRSHPNAVEVKWARPQWVEDLQLLTEVNVRTIREFNSFMNDLSGPRPLPAKDRSVV
jgi:hypothetical protein